LLAAPPSELNEAQWSDLLSEARRLGLIGRLAECLAARKHDLSQKVRDQLEAAQRIADKHRTTLAWEIERVGATLAPLDIPVVLLKGAAYLARGLPPSRGRFASDIDILVPEDRIGAVEEQLLQAGWLTIQTDDYDQRYFRDWMHEIPPLRHALRNTTIDVHHTILPPTSRLSRGLSSRQLFDRAKPLGRGPLATLCDEDMVLHSAAHRFSEGEHQRALRDLIDIHDLIEHFSAAAPTFWVTLIDRARELGLERPLYYAVHFCERLLGTRAPAAHALQIEDFAPPAPLRRLMDAIVPTAFLAADPGVRERTALWALYARGHYLRMPWSLLIPHLARKAVRRLREKGAPSPGEDIA